MSKGLGLIGLLVIIVVGTYLYTHQAAKEMVKSDAMDTIDTAKDTKDLLEKKAVVSSIKDAMGLGTTMKCVYTMDKAGKNYQSEVIVEGEKFRSTSTIDGVTSYALSTDDNQYMWTSKDTKGFKMTKACMEDFKKMMPATEDKTKMPTMEDAKAALDMAQNIECNPTDSIDFSVPENITFTDQCAMLKDSMKMMEQYKDKMPAGMNMPAMQQ